MERDIEHHPDDEPALSFDFRRYAEALRKYAWAVLAIVAFAITIAVVYTNRQPKIYQATASVQIEPKIVDMFNSGQAARGGLDGGIADSYYKQQKQVLVSYRLVRQTVEEHRLYLRMLTELQRKDRKLDDQVEDATQLLLMQIKASYPNADRIMYVSVRDRDPKLAAEIANDHVQTYLNYSKGLLSTDSKQTSTALSAEFDDAETKLRAAETDVYQFQKDNDVLAVMSLEDRQTLLSQSISAYTVKVNDAHSKRLELQARLERMRAAADGDVLQSPILAMGETGAFDSLRASYYTERNRFTELEREVGPKNPQYQMQKAKMDDLLSALQSESKRVLNGLEEQVKAQIATESALKSEIERATKEALALGPKVLAYNELQRRKKSLEDRYNILRARLSSTELTDRMNHNIDLMNILPLDPALVPVTPVSPSLQINIVVAAVLSLLAGLGLISLLVFLDRSIKTTTDAQQAAGVPVLGIIPVLDEALLKTDDRSRGSRDLYVHDNPTSLVAECCRSVRTNILFSAADKNLKTIVVSSANPREGKTMSVMYLGTTMAQSGQRVLLVDTDMRRPRLHESTGVSRNTGLSNLIVGDHDYDDVIKATGIPNLSILPCGPLPPNPAELLMSHRFETVLEELKKRFDLVIFDSPPLQVVTDAVVLSKQTDGVILISRADKTRRDELKRSARQIKNVRGNIFGVIVNAIEPDSRSGYYYSYYGYTEKQPATT